MAVSQAKKTDMATAAMRLARELTNFNRDYNSFKEEYDAIDYGSLVTDAILDITQMPELTAAEWVDGVAALDAISTAIELNKTNLYKIASTRDPE